MKAVLKPCNLVALLSLLLMCLCSCATTQPPLPANVSMNKEAGREGWLIAMVRVNKGEPLPFVVDTGSPITCLDNSLESGLGKRLTDANYMNWGTSHPGGAYRPPEFYLGTTPLQKTGRFIVTVDCKPWSDTAHIPFTGILGMDVLKHYCVQLDFQNRQMRFLEGAHADRKDWGRPFHLTNIGDGCMGIDENLTGAKGPRSMIDTGDDNDGGLTSKLYQQWTNHVTLPAHGEVRTPNGVMGGEFYHELYLVEIKKFRHDLHTRFNVIGIRVLSENLVTLDFPERTMYLKRMSDRPLTDTTSTR